MANPLWAAEYLRLQVAEPYVEVYTGPGDGYPIFHVVDRYEWIDIIKRKTDWFKVLTKDGKIGWVYIDDIEKTLAAPGHQTKIFKRGQKHFQEREIEMGVLAGQFEGTKVMTIYGAYNFTKNLALEVAASQATDTFTNTVLGNVYLVSSPFPEWWISPFFGLGVGYMENEPKETFVLAETVKDGVASVAFGTRIYLARRFFMRLEGRQYTAFTEDNNSNEEYDEWKAGFSFFF